MATYWMDNNGATAGFGTLNAAWNTAGAFWTTSSAGTTAPTAIDWATATENDTAQFGATGTTATAGTSTIATGTTVLLNRLATQNLAALQTISGTGAGTGLAFRGTSPTIDVGSAGGLLISAPVSGTNLSRSGTGYVQFSVATTLSGVFTVNSGSGVTYIGQQGAGVFSANLIPSVTSVVIPAGCKFAYGGTVDFLSNATYTGDGALVVGMGSSNGLSNVPIQFKAGALAGLTGIGAPVSAQATAGLQVGSPSIGSTATVRDFPRLLTYYVNAFLYASSISVNVASDAVGGTYPTTINYNAWDNSGGGTRGLYANQANGNGPIILTGGFTTAGVNANLPFVLGGTNTEYNTLSGNVTNGTAPVSFTKSGVGRWVLSGTGNTYTNGNSITAGTLAAASVGALGTGTTTVSSGATLELLNNAIVTNNITSVSGTGASSTGAIYSSSGQNALSGTVTLAGATTIRSETGSGLKLTGAIVAAANVLTKTGGGVFSTQSTSCTGTGAINVSAGTLYVDSESSSSLPTGAITVASASTLAANTSAKSPRVPGPVTLQAGSTLRFGAP